MLDWFYRWRLRQREIAAGADADLFRDNSKRWKLFWFLLGCALLMVGLEASVKLTGFLDQIAKTLTIILFIGAFLIGRWASAQDYFLQRPGPKDPPTLFK